MRSAFPASFHAKMATMALEEAQQYLDQGEDPYFVVGYLQQSLAQAAIFLQQESEREASRPGPLLPGEVRY